MSNLRKLKHVGFVYVTANTTNISGSCRLYSIHPSVGCNTKIIMSSASNCLSKSLGSSESFDLALTEKAALLSAHEEASITEAVVGQGSKHSLSRWSLLRFIKSIR